MDRDQELDPNDAVRNVLGEMGSVMVSWGVADSVVLEVIAHGAECEGLSAEEADEIVATVLGADAVGSSSKKKDVEAEDVDDSNNSVPDRRSASPEPSVASGSVETKSGQLKFKKGPKWIKANFSLRGNKLSYEYNEEGIGEFAEEVVLTATHEATALSDQAPGALRNYSLKLLNSADKSALHLLATKQPEIAEWISALNDVPARKGQQVSATKAPASPRGKAGSDASGKKMAAAPEPSRPSSAKAAPRPSPGPSKAPAKTGMTTASAVKKAAEPASSDQLRKGSQPPVRVTRSETQQQRLIKEGDVKMLVAKRWLRTHVELFDNSVVLTYIDPVTNTEQVREEIPVMHVLIAPNSPLAPAALKDSSWRIKDGDTGDFFFLCF